MKSISDALNTQSIFEVTVDNAYESQALNVPPVPDQISSSS
jgi:hypothetical protein